MNNAFKVIGLHGGKRTGKDTIAKYLIENHGYARVAFADAVRELLLRVNPWIQINWDDPEHIAIQYVFGDEAFERLSDLVADLGWDDAKEIADVRRLLQQHGESARDVLDPQVWIHKAHNEVKKHIEAGTNVVITDLRYPNEAEYVRDIWSGPVARVINDRAPKGDTHKSEQPIPDRLISFPIENNGTLDELHEKIEANFFNRVLREGVTPKPENSIRRLRRRCPYSI